MTPSGRVFHVEGAAAKRWWSDWASAPRGGCECRSPAAAARYAARLFKRWGYPPPPTYQVTAAHERPMILFAPKEKRLWYILTPAAHGSTTALWDRWTKAGPSIHRVVEAGETALAGAPADDVTISRLGAVPSAPNGPVSPAPAPSSWSWGRIALLGLLAITLGTAVVRRAFIHTDQGKRAVEPGVRHT
jgi:hypothetical protein